jgi:hypothetical protein
LRDCRIAGHPPLVQPIEGESSAAVEVGSASQKQAPDQHDGFLKRKLLQPTPKLREAKQHQKASDRKTQIHRRSSPCSQSATEFCLVDYANIARSPKIIDQFFAFDRGNWRFGCLIRSVKLMFNQLLDLGHDFSIYVLASMIHIAPLDSCCWVAAIGEVQ